jgi:diguanylate cyclase (GGDEF)-like protein
VSDTTVGAQGEIEAALEGLRAAVRKAVRAEQLVDRLTHLGNDEALGEWLQDQIDRGAEFWLAFIEVDRFKNINDEFGYELADQLLLRIADQLRNGATNFFASQATPFRAHGDEFYLGGPGLGDGVHEALDQIRGAIGAVRVVDRGHTKPMRCTVSVGWVTSVEVQNSELLTGRSVRTLLDATVADAKRDRNCVRRYDPAMRKAQLRDGRADCGACGAKFTVTVPITDTRAGPLVCPNCGESVERPSSLRGGSS